MAERLSRSPVRLAGGLPDGNLSSLAEHGTVLLADDPAPLYAIVRITRSKREEQDDNDGASLAICKVRALEVLDSLPDDARPGMPMSELLTQVRANRTGDAILDFENATDHAAQDEAKVALTDWQAAEGLSDTEMGGEWKDYFGDDAGSWRDADARTITEFLTAKREQDDDGEAVPDAV